VLEHLHIITAAYHFVTKIGQRMKYFHAHNIDMRQAVTHRTYGNFDFSPMYNENKSIKSHFPQYSYCLSFFIYECVTSHAVLSMVLLKDRRRLSSGGKSRFCQPLGRIFRPFEISAAAENFYPVVIFTPIRRTNFYVFARTKILILPSKIIK
jgi:hypothetical protein